MKISYTENSLSPLSYFLDPHKEIKNPKTLDWNCRKWIESKPENITARLINVNAEMHPSNAKKSLCMCGNYFQQDNGEEYELVWHVWYEIQILDESRNTRIINLKKYREISIK